MRPARNLHEHAQGFNHAALTHGSPADAAEAVLAVDNATIAGGHRKMDEADRFAWDRASWAGDPGNRDRKIDIGALQRADRHLSCGLLADRAERR
jgi:hypothetical protein